MRRAGVVLAAVVVSVLLTMARPTATLAHSLLTSSVPAANSSVKTAPTAISLVFTEPPDPKLTSVQVLDAAGGSHTAGKAQPVAGSPQTLRVPLGKLADGVYTVAWRTVSMTDGHATAGSFAFSVGVAAPTGATQASVTGGGGGTADISATTVASRWLLYLGLVALLGAAVATELSGRRRGPLRWFAVGAWAVALVASVLLVASQAADAGVSIGDLPGTSLGSTAIARVVPLLAAGLLFLVPRTGGRRDAIVTRLIGAMAAAAMLVEAVSSHAASAAIAPLQIAVSWLHFATAGVWLGGLAGILLLLRGAPTEERAGLVRRFSRWATAGIALVAITGAVRAISELTSPADLITTDYGRLILLKTALLAVVAALAAVNHFRNVPAGQGGLGGIRRFGSLEVMGGIVLLLVASTLVNVPPPVDASGVAAPTPLTADGHDYATSVRLHLEVSPGTAGPNTFRVSAVDYDSGAPEPGDSVSLRFVYPSRPSIGASTLTLKSAGSGIFTGSGANLSLGGDWSLTALVTTAAGAVEVPLSVHVPTPPQQVDVSRAAGLPTLYTVHLPGGDACQLYLDLSAGPGAYLHITFFDATGGELAATDIKATIATGGGRPLPVTLAPLDPGHVAGHVDATAGRTVNVAVTATAPDGSPFVFQLDMTP
jgi:copper transport protein